MDSFFSAFHKVIGVGFTSLGIMVASVLPVHHATKTTVQSHVVQHVITIHKTISAMGKQVTILLVLPKNGGLIDGTVSGDCQGSIDGTYSGQPQYAMNGKGEVTCSIGLLSLPANASFTGTLHPDQKDADITYTITGSGFSKTGNVTVPYTE